MTKGIKLTAAALLVASGAYAQTTADSLQVLDNADFTFTESQLDEDNDAAQTVATISGSKSDPYYSEVGYRFSPMRFRVRGYDNMYNSYYMNGLQLNDLELGRFSYGMVGGMNDATRNQEGLSPFDYNRLGFVGIGGATDVNARAGRFAQGSKITLSGCNRNYVARGMFSHATGYLPSGWAFAGQIGYRWANEGVIEGTFYNSFSYFLAAEKKFGDKHTLSLVTFGSPTQRGQQGASTEEAYWLANSHYYNPNWGYQNGEKRNSRIVNDFEPTAILTWDWDINEKTKWTTAAGFKYSWYSSTALGWNGDAYDPRPDYYKNLPSSVFNVYDPTVNNPDYLAQHPWFLEEYNALKDYWMADDANRQINWDRMYFVNRQNEAAGGEALYYQERRHNDQMVAAFNSVLSRDINKENKYTVGASFNFTKGMHYKTMADLLGGTRYTDVDKFAQNDYGPDAPEIQNDLRNPNAKIGVGDKFGYNYNIYVMKARAFGQYQYTKDIFSFDAKGYVEGTTIEREGLMQNGRAPENSYGKSGMAKFLTGGGRLGIQLRPNNNHIISLNAGIQNEAPLARNSFVAPRIQNNFVDHLTSEKIYSTELAYRFRIGDVTAKVAGYYTLFTDGVEQTAFYNDQENRFTYLTMSGIRREHMGVEAALKWDITSNLSFNVLGTLSDARYTNNPLAQVNYEGMNAETIADLNQWQNRVTGENMPLQVLAKGMRTNGTPLTALSFGLNYNINGWFFEINANYYDRVYIDFSEYRRLGNIVTASTNSGKSWAVVSTEEDLVTFIKSQDVKDYSGIAFDAEGNILATRAAEQEKCKGGWMLDLSIGKYIRMKKGKSLSINLQVQNLTNNCNMKTGGYEQNRDDNYSSGYERAYVFSKNPKYYYANALNAFLNIGFKF